MADLVKKIKIKKQDGTFTDYIPIGAEAQNISTSDGDSVQLKLNKKPYHYNNVADMKADTKLKVGDYICTLGYYEANDGGAGDYRVVSGNYTDNGGSYHQLKNNLYAELIIKDKINVKQFGAYGDNTHDDTLSFQNAINYIDKDGTVCVPKGTYKISSTLTTNVSISIIGTNDVPKIIFIGTGKLFSILGHENINSLYETRPRNSSSEFKPILKQLCLTTGLTTGHGKENTIAISFDSEINTIIARGFLENIHI